MRLSNFNDVMENAYEEKHRTRSVHIFMNCANAFNGFYHETKILGEENAEKQKSYIALLKVTKMYWKDVLTYLDLKHRKGCK